MTTKEFAKMLRTEELTFKARLATEVTVDESAEEGDEMTELEAENYQEFLADLAADREFWTEEDWEAQRKFDAQVARYGSPL